MGIEDMGRTKLRKKEISAALAEQARVAETWKTMSGLLAELDEALKNLADSVLDAYIRVLPEKRFEKE
jgi:hypothetical protein